MTDQTYNGWTNYATWRVNLEMIDGIDPELFGIDTVHDIAGPDTSDVADAIQSFVDEIMDNGPDGLAKDYANAFISDVNWYEIAEHLTENEQAAAA
jgi:hypothetical protein